MRNGARTAALITALSLAGCIPNAPKSQTESSSTPPNDMADLKGACSTKGIDNAIGKTLTPELIASLKMQAKADTVRVAPQNGMITMDFSPLRLNIFHDDKDVIVQINCG